MPKRQLAVLVVESRYCIGIAHAVRAEAYGLFPLYSRGSVSTDMPAVFACEPTQPPIPGYLLELIVIE